jgi:hypothetical protein
MNADAVGEVCAPVDRDALLAALVLAPTTFARNRFFALFKEPWAAKARARAGQLRMIVRHLSPEVGGEREAGAEVFEVSNEGERTVLRYTVPALHLVRTAVLERLELALLRFALLRRGVGGAEPPDLAGALRMTNDDRALVEGALAKLSRELQMGGP